MADKLSFRLVQELQAHVGPDIEILTDASNIHFQEYAKRWTDIDRKTPSAIVLPASEEQIQKTVQEPFALICRLPLTCCCEGTMGRSIISALCH